MKNALSNLYEKAHKLDPTITELLEFIKILINLRDKGKIEALDMITIATVATTKTLSKKEEITNYQIQEVMWKYITNLFVDDNQIVTKLLKTKNTLFPSTNNPHVVITPEIFDWLKIEAKNLLENNPDADDGEKIYWKAIIKGKVPFGINIQDNL